jgi:hypothetical protein
MKQASILRSRVPILQENTHPWQRRAQQARRIATMLTGDDALLCEQFAMECEAKAAQRPKAAIAA